MQGDSGMKGSFATRVSGSADLYKVSFFINIIALYCFPFTIIFFFFITINLVLLMFHHANLLSCLICILNFKWDDLPQLENSIKLNIELGSVLGSKTYPQCFIVSSEVRRGDTPLQSKEQNAFYFILRQPYIFFSENDIFLHKLS